MCSFGASQLSNTRRKFCLVATARHYLATR
jgi:hypothetical protein